LKIIFGRTIVCEKCEAELEKRGFLIDALLTFVGVLIAPFFVMGDMPASLKAIVTLLLVAALLLVYVRLVKLVQPGDCGSRGDSGSDQR
jgi:hypothetical protein